MVTGSGVASRQPSEKPRDEYQNMLSQEPTRGRRVPAPNLVPSSPSPLSVSLFPFRAPFYYILFLSLLFGPLGFDFSKKVLPTHPECHFHFPRFLKNELKEGFFAYDAYSSETNPLILRLIECKNLIVQKTYTTHW